LSIPLKNHRIISSDARRPVNPAYWYAMQLKITLVARNLIAAASVIGIHYGKDFSIETDVGT